MNNRAYNTASMRNRQYNHILADRNNSMNYYKHFMCGGYKHAYGGGIDDLQNYDYGFENNYNFDTFANGGTMQDFVSYNEGDTHDNNPLGGIPIGKHSSVEQGEVKYKSKKHGEYIFTNRF